LYECTYLHIYLLHSLLTTYQIINWHTTWANKYLWIIIHLLSLVSSWSSLTFSVQNYDPFCHNSHAFQFFNYYKIFFTFYSVGKYWSIAFRDCISSKYLIIKRDIHFYNLTLWYSGNSIIVGIRWILVLHTIIKIFSHLNPELSHAFLHT
jgi:hypothetical protein